MSIYAEIKKLTAYGLEKQLIAKEDEIYVLNQILQVMQMDESEDVDITGEEIVLPEVLNALCDEAVARGILHDDNVSRDLFDTKLMGVMIDRPAHIIDEFWKKYKENDKVQRVFASLRPAGLGLIASACFTVILNAVYGTGTFSIIYFAIFLAFFIALQIPKIKNIHPIVFILLAAVIGIVFKL